MSDHTLIAKNRDTGDFEEMPVVVDLTEGAMSPMERFWSQFVDPSDDPKGYIIVPLWPFTPAGCRAHRQKGDRFKKEWRGGQYVSGPLDHRTGLVGVGVPIRVRSLKYAQMLCEPPNEGVTIGQKQHGGGPVQMIPDQRAEWPEKMWLEKLPPKYRNKFGNERRWKPRSAMAAATDAPTKAPNLHLKP